MLNVCVKAEQDTINGLVAMAIIGKKPDFQGYARECVADTAASADGYEFVHGAAALEEAAQNAFGKEWRDSTDILTAIDEAIYRAPVAGVSLENNPAGLQFQVMFDITEEQVMEQAAQHLREYQLRKEKAAGENEFQAYMELFRERNPVEVQEESHSEWENATWEAYRELFARKEDIAGTLDLAWMEGRLDISTDIEAIHSGPDGWLMFEDTGREKDMIQVKRDQIAMASPCPLSSDYYVKLKLLPAYAVDEDAFLRAMETSGYRGRDTFACAERQMRIAISGVDCVRQELLQELEDRFPEEKVQDEDIER